MRGGAGREEEVDTNIDMEERSGAEEEWDEGRGCMRLK